MYGSNLSQQTNKQPADRQETAAGAPPAPTPNIYENPYKNIKKPLVFQRPAPAAAPASNQPVASNPYQKYKEQSLTTMSQGELLVKLYDELIKQMRIAALSLEKKMTAPAERSLLKAETILTTLEAALDMQFEISANLRDLYIFTAKQLLKANNENDPAPVEECLPLIRELRDSFEQAEKIARQEQHSTVGSHAL